MSKAIIVSPQIEDIARIFSSMAAEMQRQKISCVLIAYQSPEAMTLISKGDHSSLGVLLAAQLKYTMSKCNQDEKDVIKGIILKEIFNQ
jgi:hypothetical protein